MIFNKGTKYISDELIVLCTNNSINQEIFEGTVVGGEYLSKPLGYHSDCWMSFLFIEHKEDSDMFPIF
jgi:hypothetical protein